MRLSLPWLQNLLYKEVAVSPPGTVLKPLIEKVEEPNEKKTESHDVEVHQSKPALETSGPELEEMVCSSKEEIPRSKLSAAAPPFNPGAVPLSQTLTSVSMNVYNVIDSQKSLLSQSSSHQLPLEFLVGPDCLCSTGCAILCE
ncbi:hypothetical protein LguiA_009850 [Lonicera macranthoides]